MRFLRFFCQLVILCWVVSGNTYAGSWVDIAGEIHTHLDTSEEVFNKGDKKSAGKPIFVIKWSEQSHAAA